MDSPAPRKHNTSPADEVEVRRLYRQWLESWNERRAEGFADLLEEDSNLVGFDGSLMDGRLDIVAHIRQVFADHQTAAYVGKIRSVRFLASEVALLRAVAGMVPPGKSDLNPAVNTIQTLLAVKRQSRWGIALFQIRRPSSTGGPTWPNS